MATLEQLRQLFPGDLSDEDVIRRASARFKIDARAIADEVGYDGGTSSLTRERVSSSVDNFQASLYGVVGAGAKALGLPTAASWAERRRADNALQADVATDRARSQGAVESIKDVRGPSSFANYAGGLLANTAPQMAAMGVGGLAGFAIGGPVGAVAGAAAAGYPINVGQVLDAQRDQNGQTDLLFAGGLAVPYTLVDTLTGAGGAVTKMAARVAKTETGNMLKRVGKGALKTSAEESAGETFQTGLEQAGRMVVDPTETFFNEKSNDRFLESAAGGAVLGGMFGGAAGLRKRAAPPTPVNDAPGASTDLLQPDTALSAPKALGYSPIPGTPIAFPDGSMAVGTDQELMARYNLSAEQIARLRAGSGPGAAYATAGDGG